MLYVFSLSTTNPCVVHPQSGLINKLIWNKSLCNQDRCVAIKADRSCWTCISRWVYSESPTGRSKEKRFSSKNTVKLTSWFSEINFLDSSSVSAFCARVRTNFWGVVFPCIVLKLQSISASSWPFQVALLFCALKLRTTRFIFVFYDRLIILDGPRVRLSLSLLSFYHVSNSRVRQVKNHGNLLIVAMDSIEALCYYFSRMHSNLQYLL